MRPFHLHDFLEKVSDLLVEVKAIEGPLRMTRYEFGEARKKKKETSRTTSMFASRDSYSYTEEEIAEYEKQEAESSRDPPVQAADQPRQPRIRRVSAQTIKLACKISGALRSNGRSCPRCTPGGWNGTLTSLRCSEAFLVLQPLDLCWSWPGVPAAALENTMESGGYWSQSPTKI